MARTDTLNNFLTDVATAIRTKGGTSEEIKASEFDTAITNLPSGGSSEFESEYVAWLAEAKTADGYKPPLPPNITTIGAYSFYGSGHLVWETLPDTITKINAYAFANCSDLPLTKLPSALKTLGRNAFYYCKELQITEIPDGVTAFLNSCFQNCSGLKSMALPPNLKSISSGAFQNCTSVLEYDFSRATIIPTLGATNAFGSIKSSCVIKVPSALYDEWVVATNWAHYADKIVAV